MLLVHQLNTGNMTPAELDWACSQLRAWSRRLALDAVPRSPEGFFVDIAGKTGLQRRTGNDSRLDAALPRHVAAGRPDRPRDRGAAAGRERPTRDPPRRSTSSASRSSRRCARRSRPTCSPTCAAIRASRASRQARVRIGLARICRELAAKDVADVVRRQRAAPSRSRCTPSPTRRASRRPTPDEHDSLVASLSSFSDPMWQVKDRSVAGLRIAASGGIGQSLALGGAGRRAPERRLRLGARRRAPAEQGVATKRSRPACRSSPSASCR